MELYKFISENEVKRYKNGFVVLNNKVYTNPTDNVIRQAGYKPLEEFEKPEFDINTQYLVRTYIDEGDKISVNYTVSSIRGGENED